MSTGTQPLDARQQALEALVNVARDLAIGQIDDMRRSLGNCLPHRQAAAQRDLEQIDAAIARLMADLAQPDEPVAQIETTGSQGGCFGWLRGRRAGIGAKLYPAPQPATGAQPLTFDELHEMYRLAMLDETQSTVASFARAIERAHKIGATT